MTSYFQFPVVTEATKTSPPSRKWPREFTFLLIKSLFTKQRITVLNKNVSLGLSLSWAELNQKTFHKANGPMEIWRRMWLEPVAEHQQHTDLREFWALEMNAARRRDNKDGHIEFIQPIIQLQMSSIFNSPKGFELEELLLWVVFLQ